MGNHESFLKMIGMKPETSAEEVASRAESAELPQAPTEDSWGVFDLKEPSQPTTSETEWEIPESAEVVEASPEIQEDPPAPEAQSVEVSEWSQPATESGELNAEFDEGPTRTERYGDGEAPEAEPTAVYSPEEVERISAEEVRGLTLTGSDQTRPTVPFNYDKSRVSQLSGVEDSEARTAHFDYSRQQGDCRMVLLEGEANAQAFHLSQLPLRIGRDPQNEVVIDDINVSRFHAEIRDAAGSFEVVDLGSTNGVKVNGKIVTQLILKSHDILQVGDCLFEFLEPGVLSKGVPLAAVAAAEGATVPKRRMSRKRMFLYGGLILFGGLLWLGAQLLQNPEVREAAQQQILEAAAGAAQKEIEALRSTMEKTFQASIERIESEEVKKAFIERFEAKGLFGFAPDAKEQVQALPAQVVHLLVIHPDLFGRAIAAGGSVEAFVAVLRTKINQLIEAQNFEQAFKVTGVLLAISGDDAQVKEAYEKLKIIVERSKPKNDRGESQFSAAEQKFFGYMEEHENFVIKLLDEGKTSDALRYSEIVVEKLQELVKQDAQYERVATEEISRWTERVSQLKSKSQEKKEKQRRVAENEAAGNELYDRIQESFDLGTLAEAKKLVAVFLNDFPTHPRFEDVQSIGEQIDQMVERSFQATKASVETLMGQESFENAWIELYRFKELMPQFGPVEELREALDKRATPKAVQFYNQARVFEFEADDLVAAEQYYKKTLETADPESDLFKKAKRRFEDVKRKGIR